MPIVPPTKLLMTGVNTIVTLPAPERSPSSCKGSPMYVSKCFAYVSVSYSRPKSW